MLSPETTIGRALAGHAPGEASFVHGCNRLKPARRRAESGSSSALCAGLARSAGLLQRGFQPLERLAARGRADIVWELAHPLPMTVISEVLGVPRSDLDTFKRWSHDLVARLSFDLPLERQKECDGHEGQFLPRWLARAPRQPAGDRDRPEGVPEQPDVGDRLSSSHLPVPEPEQLGRASGRPCRRGTRERAGRSREKGPAGQAGANLRRPGLAGAAAFRESMSRS